MNLLENLGIETVEQNKNRVTLKMKVEDKHLQPYKIMHGGINAVLAETAASIGANLNISEPDEVAVGVDISTHHLNTVKDGVINAEAMPIKIGYNIQVWQVITHPEGSSINNSMSTVTLKKVKLH
ncbi:PaaI family thioesterase [Companilactobacillus hulinensis]|uniref:PaaI family thioesterase n=1 Tax=Companilactobacillus hulinensis TaxID=2486007 RepID=UPI000F76AE68|nr:PaaI family thioesterase [Companilactobacillus hulinensis]